MDPLALSGLPAAGAMLACDAPEARGPRFVLGLAASCAMGSLYGFLRGVALRRGGGGVVAHGAAAVAEAARRGRGQRCGKGA